ncbi:MAG: 4-hydroxy-3-methylbut-2-enyl diphosphate reductase [Candidatus Omnitrophica bacterium]|nr:4-hydroxy-3-methylbut-2-enyl diphosphate reductase [Candidatus Omnitrophota bacterium]
MRINLAKSAGFCFGVKRALKIAFETASWKTRAYILGDIVHNESVVRELEKAGIRKIRKLSYGKNKTLLIRAHGAGKDILNKASHLGYNVIDATCPMVREIHKIAQAMEQKGYKIIIIGDKEHDEVRGISGQLKEKAIIIDNPKEIPLKKIKRINKAAIVVQSTQDLEKVIGIVNILKTYLKDLKFFNTICMPTRIKQEEIKTMALDNDVVIVIGSKASANTKRLYKISKSLNQRTYWVRSKDEIKPGWLKDAKNVGITAGASTPDSTTEDVVKYLQQLRLHHY